MSIELTNLLNGLFAGILSGNADLVTMTKHVAQEIINECIKLEQENEYLEQELSRLVLEKHYYGDYHTKELHPEG